jgi:hypothetical protein
MRPVSSLPFLLANEGMRLRPLRNLGNFTVREPPLLAMFLSPNSARKEPEETIYPGKPLQRDEIRLIKLQPGRWIDPIVCELTNVPLDASRYRALSYVWGSQKVIRTIRRDSSLGRCTVCILGGDVQRSSTEQS